MKDKSASHKDSTEIDCDSQSISRLKDEHIIRTVPELCKRYGQVVATRVVTKPCSVYDQDANTEHERVVLL